MPKGATPKQRLAWHLQHQKHCACRPIPATLLATAEPAPAPPPVDARFAAVVKAFARDGDVTYGGKGFGKTGLKRKGKIFAMLSSKGEFVAKLPKARVDELVRARQGKAFDPGHGRVMKEWLVVTGAATSWIDLAREAYRFALVRHG